MTTSVRVFFFILKLSFFTKNVTKKTFRKHYPTGFQVFKSADNNLCSPPNEQQSLCSILRQSFKFMISPVFVVQLSTFMFSNISMHLMLNVVNDLMMRSDNVMQNQTSFEIIQQQFDLSRGALGIALPPLCGLINEASSACFQFCVENYFNF